MRGWTTGRPMSGWATCCCRSVRCWASCRGSMRCWTTARSPVRCWTAARKPVRCRATRWVIRGWAIAG